MPNEMYEALAMVRAPRESEPRYKDWNSELLSQSAGSDQGFFHRCIERDDFKTHKVTDVSG